MKTADELKKIVQEKYGEIASGQNPSCCGSDSDSPEVYNIMTDDYSHVKGYNADADLGLGCGLPTQFANILPGDTVIDLGSGAGNDCFIARNETGESGKVIGIDFTEAMIKKARLNAEKLGLNNVEFRQGDIEDLPVSDNVADVIVSNCVLNLVPNKEKVMREIFRTLKPGGHFSISDIVLIGELPDELRANVEMYVGCVGGAIQKEAYLNDIQHAGFQQITIQKQKPIILSDSILDRFLPKEQKEAFQRGDSGIFSITVFAQKPGFKPLKIIAGDLNDSNSCDTGSPSSACC